MTQSKTAFEQLCAQIWWLVLLRGISVSVLGILLLSRPAATVTLVVFFLGFYWFADGILTVINSVRGRKYLERWGWGLFIGSISSFAGLVVLSQPLASAILTTTFLIYLLAFAALVSGIGSIVTGVRLRTEGEKEWSMILGGLLHTVLGILLLSQPMVSAIFFVWLLGVLSLIGGIALIILALRIRKVGKN